MTAKIKRRAFVTLLSGAAAWPLAARAQQALPVIGFLSARSPRESASVEAGFREGLKETGYVEGQNVHIAFRWADGQFDELPTLAAELVRRQVGVIIAIGGGNTALAAKSATTTIPIVFVVGFDPVVAGLVASLNRPSGNLTGMTLMSPSLGQKRLELLRELAPNAAVVAMLVNPQNPDGVPEIGDIEDAARGMGIGIKAFSANRSSDLYSAFSEIAELRPDALLVVSSPFFLVRREDIVALAARIKCPVIYPFREFADSGGLLSYGANIPSAYREAGNYAGRILKGAKPADLPVMQPAKFELVLNLKTAKSLGLTVPPTLLAIADEVIE
jgi:putative tryptophan/tyrosine transport system substrate-binding protein